MQVLQHTIVNSRRPAVAGYAAVITRPGHVEMKQTTFRAPAMDEVRVRLDRRVRCNNRQPARHAQVDVQRVAVVEREDDPLAAPRDL